MRREEKQTKEKQYVSLYTKYVLKVMVNFKQQSKVKHDFVCFAHRHSRHLKENIGILSNILHQVGFLEYAFSISQ